MQEMSRKNQYFTDSVIRRMTRISIDCGAINLAQGFPDFDPPKAMLDRLSEKLLALEGVCLNGAHEAPHILSIAIPGVPTQNSINILQDHGICVSAGSACAKGHRSHVLEAMKVSPERIDGSFRISLCKDTAEEELELLYTVIRDEILPRA